MKLLFSSFLMLFMLTACDPPGPIAGGSCDYIYVQHPLVKTEQGIEVSELDTLRMKIERELDGQDSWYKQGMFEGDISEYFSQYDMDLIESTRTGSYLWGRFSIMTTGACTPVSISIIPEEPADP